MCHRVIGLPLYIPDMAEAIASTPCDQSAQPHTSLHSICSVYRYDPNQAVVMTEEIIRRRPSSGVYFKIVNQYGFKVKVGKGQHGEVFLAENIHQTKSVVVSPLPSPYSRSLPYPIPLIPACPLGTLHVMDRL